MFGIPEGIPEGVRFSVFEEAPIAVAIARATRLLWVNREYAVMFGYDSPDELVGRSVLELNDDSFRESIDQRVARRESGAPVPSAYEAVGLRKDGTTFPYHVRTSLIELPDGPATVGFLAETGMGTAETLRLRESLDHYRSLFTYSPVSLWEEDLSAVRIYLDRLRASGIRDLRAHFAEHLDAMLPCLTLARIAQVNEATLHLYEASSALEFAARMGDIVDPSSYFAFADAVLSLYDGERFIETEAKNRTLSGKPLDVVVRAYVAPGSEESWARILVSIVDVTQRKQVQEALRRHEERLLNSQRLETVGRLAAGVAHDFNNLLTVISGYAGLLLQGTDDPVVRGELSQIARAAEAGSSLTRQLLAFGRQEPRSPEVVDLVALLTGLRGMLERVLGPAVDLEVDLPGYPLLAEVDRGQMEQVIMNLVTNASDAMPEGGRLDVTARERRLQTETAFGDRLLPPGRYVEFAFCDTGHGVHPDAASRIFEPFFTTKPPGRGTGLGLSTVHGILAQNQGGILLDGCRPAGATFRFIIPAARSATSQTAATLDADFEALSGGETVLLAEDEPAVRTLVSRVLSRLGYAVRPTENGQAALDLFHADPSSIDVLLTDLMMPVMNGKQLARAARDSRPDLPIVFMTGYADKGSTPDMSHVPSTSLLNKPFTPGELARRIREALDGAPR